MDILTYHMQDIMGKNNDLSSYSKAINETISKDGVTISLGDVILDEESMFINYSVKDENTYDSEEAKLGSGIDVMLYVNGIPSFGGMRGASMHDGENTDTEVCLMECDYRPKNLEKEQQYKIRFSYYNENGKAKKIGDISFVADGNQLMKDTYRVEINREITLTRGTVINLKEYVGNPVQQKIIVEYKKNSNDTSVIEDLELIGKDNLGRDMQFYFASSDGDTGRMILTYVNGEDTELKNPMMLFDNSMDMSEVTSFTVTPYSRMYPNKEGQVETTLQPIGDEFTINVK